MQPRLREKPEENPDISFSINVFGWLFASYIRILVKIPFDKLKRITVIM